MIELYCNFVALYNKIHTVHIKTVNMKCSANLHPTLWEHYETLQEIVDKFWEDIIVKQLQQDLPTPLDCLKKSTISGEMIYSDDEEIVNDVCKDYIYILWDIKTKTSSEKDLLIQNILLWIRETITKLKADIDRLMKDEDDMPMKTETKSETPKIKAIKPY